MTWFIFSILHKDGHIDRAVLHCVPVPRIHDVGAGQRALVRGTPARVPATQDSSRSFPRLSLQSSSPGRPGHILQLASVHRPSRRRSGHRSAPVGDRWAGQTPPADRHRVDLDGKNRGRKVHQRRCSIPRRSSKCLTTAETADVHVPPGSRRRRLRHFRLSDSGNRKASFASRK